MRTIKFRAWNKVSKLMAYEIEKEYDTISGVRYWKDGKKLEDMEPGESSFGDYLENENYIVMQSTGLHDKNGVEIWEGDVVSLDGLRGIRHYEVIWETAGFHPAGWTLRGKNDCDRNTLSHWELQRCEVLGNVHEHGHLLNAQS